jgi:hypothetical protein
MVYDHLPEGRVWTSCALVTHHGCLLLLWLTLQFGDRNQD